MWLMRPLLLALSALLVVSLAPAGVAAAEDRTGTRSDATTDTTTVATNLTHADARTRRRPFVRDASSSVPLVIAHRGASGYRPEHTIASYRLAIDLGADYVEPDLVSTKDGILVARHENEISGTTDVATHPEFADRKATKVVDGVSLTGWFTEDFTLTELKTLRAKERIPLIRQENTLYDGRFQVPTLQEVIALVKTESRRTGRHIGIYPETKHPTYFDSVGLSLEEPLITTLRRNSLDRPGAKVFIQSFETGNLRQLARMTRLPLVQLLGSSGAPYDLVAAGDSRTYADLVTPAGLRDIATYADAIGPDKTMVIPRNPDSTLGAPTALVTDAHAAGLLVHAYTFRAENTFLPLDYRSNTVPADFGNLLGEITAYLEAGLDGFFTDQADLGVLARDEFLDEAAAA